ncbi:transposable element Tcb1 transposase [Trichonephila clavipes]|nr:transposable element Tcb1 transposase [Trichonephila clavipes]
MRNLDIHLNLDNYTRAFGGRPRNFEPWSSDEDDTFTAKRNRRSTASDLSRQLSSATGTTLSRQTVYRRLRRIGLYARRPVRCVPLTATHCRQRLTWSREHALWTPQQWSCVMFSNESRTDLRVQSVTKTGHIYRDVILEQHVRLFRDAMGAEFLFRDNDTRPHRANIVDECLQTKHIPRMDWPAYSSDLNPIDLVWDMLGSPSTPSHLSTGTSEGIA